MLRNRIRLCAAGLSMLVIATAAYAGGWAILTVTDFPDYAVAGRTLSVTFMVRQHGVTPVSGLKPVVYAKMAGRQEWTILPRPASREGEYRFEVTPTHPGDWQITIDSRFISYMTGNDSRNEDSPKSPAAGFVTLPLKVITSRDTPPAISMRTRGEHLFQAKGCAGCHSTGIAPELAGKRLSADYLNRLLADPEGTLKLPEAQFERMPNLQLKPDEIAALSALLAAN